jgi:hypothetical protein
MPMAHALPDGDGRRTVTRIFHRDRHRNDISCKPQAENG